MNTSASLASKVAQVASHQGARRMSSTAKVWIDKNTRVICQGFTGKQVGVLLLLMMMLLLQHGIVSDVGSLFFYFCLDFFLIGNLSLHASH